MQKPLETVVIPMSVFLLCSYTEFRGVTSLEFLRDVLIDSPLPGARVYYYKYKESFKNSGIDIQIFYSLI